MPKTKELRSELKKIKKEYGEKFMQLCRELFPTILEKEGELYSILSSSFASNCRKTLYEDLMREKLEYEFKDYIYSKYDAKTLMQEWSEEKTPYEILEEAGYDLYECTTEEEIQSFKKYYAKKEELCTFRGGRLDRCVVFFAVRKDVDTIRREDFKEPAREDEYGTSVMGIQFDKFGMCTVSIKNRYNHSVNNPDATYGNDLDKIAIGLKHSFKVLLAERGLGLDNSNVEQFQIPGYKVADDGKYYKYNMELNGIYYCPGNIVIANGQAKKLENPENQILADYFVIYTKQKKIQLYDKKIIDAFVYEFQNIKKIEIVRNKEKETREIIIYKEDEEPIIIEIDRDNQIIGYENKNLIHTEENFLYGNRVLKRLELPNLSQVGNSFLYHNINLTEVDFPSLISVRDSFMCYNECLENFNAPNLAEVGDNFLQDNKGIKTLNLPKLESVRDDFLVSNNALQEVNLDKLKKAGRNFLSQNEKLTELKLNNLILAR